VNDGDGLALPAIIPIGIIDRSASFARNPRSADDLPLGAGALGLAHATRGRLAGAQP
jgi:hypothetical protein